MKKVLHIAILGLLVGSNSLYAQLQINTPMTLTGGVVVTVQNMDVNATASVTGNGSLSLTGAGNTNLNFAGNNVPTLQVNKTSGDVIATSNINVDNALTMTNGKLVLGSNNITLGNTATAAGSSASYVQTSGIGALTKLVNSNLSSFNLPVGNANYNPLSLNTSGTYAAGALVAARVVDAVHPNNPANPDRLNVYWPVTRTGITGTVFATGTYNDPTNFTGVEANIKGATFTASNWDYTNSDNNPTANTVSANIINTGGDLYGTNRFLFVKAKAMLQGAYNTSLLNMRDQLHAVLPTSDPYRVAPYLASFPHVNNPVVEVAPASVLTTTALGNNNIVDWVFLQLRDNSGATPGGTVVATRSALIQKDGDIVDMDGVSPVIFRNVPGGVNYTLAIRHRNHLAMCTDPATNLLTFNEKTPLTTVDFTTMTDAQIFGPSTSFKKIGSVNMLWGGNARIDSRVSFTGLNNDKDQINANLTTPAYRLNDVNLNVSSTRTGLNNDKDFILINVLNTVGTASVLQSLP